MEIAYALILGLTFGVPGILVIILLIVMFYKNKKAKDEQ